MSATPTKLAKGSALRTINFIAQVFVAFFMMPFVVYALGDRMYGFWTLVGTFIGYYGLLDFGLSAAVNRYIAGAVGSGSKDECNRIFNTAFILFLGLGVVVLLITVLLAVLTPSLTNNPEDAALFWRIILILGISIAIAFPLKAFGGLLEAQLRFDIISIIQLLSLLLRTALVIIVLMLGYQLLALALVTFLSTIPERILIIYFARKNLPYIRFNLKYWCRSTAKTFFSYSVTAFIARVADILRFHLDVMVITAFIGLSAVTHYRVASLMIHYFQNFLFSAVGIMQPVFSRLHGAGDYEAIKTTFFFASNIAIYAATFIGFGFLMWGKPFIEIWMGPEYLDVYPVLVLLVLGTTFALWQTISINLLFGISKHKIIAVLNTIEGVANLLLSILLVRYYGLIGVALGTFIPMALLKLIVQPVYVSRALSVPYYKYIGGVGKTIAISFFALIIPLLLSLRFVAPNYSILFVLALVSMFSYLLIIWLFGFSQHEKKILHRAIFSKLSLKRTAA
jgi:O-antigen/teichoic acid export membrane protein